MTPSLKVKISRNAKVTTYAFTEYFRGFESIETVKKLFGNKTKGVLENLRIEFSGRRGYMGVSNIDGHIIISADYLRNGDIIDIYLDIIHELTHVRQFMEGQELFDRNYNYVERPTEIEAFRYAIEEARNIGLSDERIFEYLKTEWISDDDLKQLANTLDVKNETST